MSLEPPETPAACYSRGMKQMAKRDWPAAIAAFDRAIQLNPAYAEAHANRGAAKNANGDPHGALDDLTKASELKPTLPGIKEIIRIVKKNAKAAPKPPAATPPAARG